MARMVLGGFGVVWCFGSVSQGSWDWGDDVVRSFLGSVFTRSLLGCH